MKVLLFQLFCFAIATRSAQSIVDTKKTFSIQTMNMKKLVSNDLCPDLPSGTIHNFDGDNYEFNDGENIYKCNLDDNYFQFTKRFNTQNCNILLYGCLFDGIQHNSNGGAILMKYSSINEVDTLNLNIIQNCKFNSCKVTGTYSNGGAIYFHTTLFCNELKLIDNIFSNNQAKASGGSLYIKGLIVTIENCQFINNHATSNANDIYCDFSKSSDTLCNINVKNNTFEHNEENAKNSAIIYINCQYQNGRFFFNSNKIRINPINSGTDVHMFLFDVSKNSKYSNEYDYSNNCILPYDENLIASEEDRLILQIDFNSKFSKCEEIVTTPFESTPAEITPTKDAFTTEPEEKCPDQPSGNLYDFNSDETSLVTDKIVYGCNFNVTKRIYTQNCVFLLHGCLFENLRGSKNGIAIYMSYQSSIQGEKKVNLIEKCQFKSCQGKDGGPVYISTRLQSYEMNFIDNLFINNEGINGGAMYFRADIGLIKNCQFINNQATNLAHDIYFDFGSEDLETVCNIKVEGNIFEHTQSNDRNNSMISLTCKHQGEKFYFNSNTIRIHPINTVQNVNIFLFNISGNSKYAYEWNYSDNCISPYDKNLITDEEDKDLIKIDFESNFNQCEGNEETPTNIPVELPPFITLDESNCSSTHRCNAQNNEDKKVFVQVLVTHFNDFINESNGGAVYIINCGFECSGTYFTNCISNTGGGGGIYIKNSLDYENSINLKDLYFTKCKAVYGSGICVTSTSELNPVTIQSCVFHSNSLIETNTGNIATNMIGGSAIFIAARKGLIIKCSYKGNTGNGGSVKVYNVFDLSSHLLHGIKSDLLLSINECFFEQNEKSSSSIYYVGGKEGSQLEIKNCEFKGKSNHSQYYIDGKLITKDSPKFFIESCKFDNKLNAISNVNLMKSYEKNDHNSYNFSMIISFVCLFTVGIAIITCALTKSYLNSSISNPIELKEDIID